MKSKEISTERKKYLKKIKLKKTAILITQLTLLIGFIALWEILARLNIIDSFITSQPSKIVKTFINLSSTGLIVHLKTTCYETLVGFSLGVGIGFIVAIVLWWSKFIAKVAEPYLVVLNSLPKIALRSNYNNMGRCWHICNNCYGTSNFLNCNNSRNTKWFFKNRFRNDKNGTNF